MLRIGEIKKGMEIGYKGQEKRIWHSCIDCGKERWVNLIKGQPRSIRCGSCAQQGLRLGELNHKWKNGRCMSGDGYVLLRIYPNDFFYPMATKGRYIREHRLVMARHLNRCLLPWEVVHHKNGNREDNRLENLELLAGQKYHIVDTVIKARITRLEREVAQQAQRILLLEAENILITPEAMNKVNLAAIDRLQPFDGISTELDES